MDEITQKKITRRMASAVGHLNGIKRMVEEDAYCINIIQQIQAVQAALDKVSALVLDTHLQTCVTEAIRGDDLAAREAKLSELSTVFKTQSKLK